MLTRPTATAIVAFQASAWCRQTHQRSEGTMSSNPIVPTGGITLHLDVGANGTWERQQGLASAAIVAMLGISLAQAHVYRMIEP